jgi:hypothetical protein
MSAQVGQHNPIPHGEAFGHRKPEFVVDGKRMKQNDWRAAAKDTVNDLSVTALDALRGRALHAGN